MDIDLLSSFPFRPTPDQSVALQILTRFVNIKSKGHVFILRGFAGTGKTTLLAHIAKVLHGNGNDGGRVVLLAPTGRAAKVLSSYCGLPAFTIHKQIYWLADGVEGDFNFTLKKNKWVDTLFIVDESSMLSAHYAGERFVLEDVMRYVYRGKGCKILFAGDNAQLPPIHLNESPALDVKFMEDHFHLPVMESTLSDVIRQTKLSGILKNATRLRMHIEDNNPDIIFDTNAVDFFDINGVDFQECVEENINQYGLTQVLCITRSNKRANLFNAELRNRLLFREDKIQASDILMCVKNNYHWLQSDDNSDVFIANGESFEILKVLKRESLYGYEFADVYIRFLDQRMPNIDIKIWLDCLMVEGPAMPMSDQRDLYSKVYADYLAIDGHIKAKQLIKKDPYFNAVQCKFSYAVTCHKAQGGQWPVVFIDHGYLTDEMMNTQVLKWMYTAVTRATQKVYLVNFNKRFFASLLI